MFLSKRWKPYKQQNFWQKLNKSLQGYRLRYGSLKNWNSNLNLFWGDTKWGNKGQPRATQSNPGQPTPISKKIQFFAL